MSDYKNAPINVCPGKTKEGYSNAESTKLCAGEQINDSLKAKYKLNQDYRLPRNPTFGDHFMNKKD